MLNGSILITGGAGFLGRGILNRAQLENWPASFKIYSRDPQKQSLIKKLYPQTNCILGDILDTERLALAMTGCDYVIHAAALKHLPECEEQPSAAIKINVDGTRSVLSAAVAAGIQRIVCISTDKAASPVNTYGMTKALVERLVFETEDFPAGDTELVACRYGNVIGSTGSVWPVFKQQASQDGRLSVTDPNMTRFFVSIDEAVDAVDSALNYSTPGTVLITNPKALNIGELAVYLTENWRLSPYKITGQRPGEKSHEVMVSFEEYGRLMPFDVLGEELVSGYELYGAASYKFRDTVLEPVFPPGLKSKDAERITPAEFCTAAETSEGI